MIFLIKGQFRKITEKGKGMEKVLNDFNEFSSLLFEKMKQINPGISQLELYEFRYALENLTPPAGWAGVRIKQEKEIEELISTLSFYKEVELKPVSGKKIVLDKNVAELTQLLFAGIASEKYSTDWVKKMFYFDIRGFVFIPDTVYFVPSVTKHFGGKPFAEFEKRQSFFENFQEIGYRDFRAANSEIDSFLSQMIEKIISGTNPPVLIGIAGPTAAGKTEITENLNNLFRAGGKRVTAIEMDNFFLDRDYREKTGAGSMGKGSIHFELLQQALKDIKRNLAIKIPRYDFVEAVSSHDNEGKIREGASPVTIEPADVVYVEGNFPFLFEEIAPLIDIKIVYITGDHMRLKRKWKRDIDYRKKYDPFYFVNRYFKTQYPKAIECYIPQLEKADIAVDTTNGEIWATGRIKKILA